MGKKDSYFVLTLPLKTEPWQETILDRRFEVNRQIYNALLQEGLKRYRQMSQTRLYRGLIQELDMTREKEARKAIYQKLDRLAETYRLTKKDFSKDSTKYRQYFPENTDAPVVQNLSANAWKAISTMMKRRSGKVHFKREGEQNTLEGKSNHTSIRYMDGCILWKKLKIPVMRKKSNYEEEALRCEIRYCRLKRQWIRGKQRYFVDLILRGACPVRKEIPIRHPGDVGISVTLKRLYLVGQFEIKRVDFPEAPESWKVKRGELIRKMEVSRRLNNPQNYRENGKIRTGPLQWNYSARYKKNRMRLKEVIRKQWVLRKERWGELVRSILEMGEHFYVERLDYRRLKASYFGKPVEAAAAATFLQLLEWKCQLHGRECVFIESDQILKEWKEMQTGCHLSIEKNTYDSGDFCHFCRAYLIRQRNKETETGWGEEEWNLFLAMYRIWAQETKSECSPLKENKVE